MLISAILTEIITEIGGDTDDTDLAAILLTCFKSGLRRVPAHINDRSFLGRDTLAIAAGSYTGSMSEISGFVKERAVWYQNSENARVPIYQPPSMNYFHNIIRPNVAGKPKYYNIYAGTFEVDVKADEALTVGMDYFKERSSIVAGDTFVGDEQMIEIAKDYCLMVYFRGQEEDLTRAREHERTAKDMMREKEGDYEEQTQGGHIAAASDD